MKIFVGIASTGRGTIIDAALRHVALQTVAPDGVVICTPHNESYRIDADAFGLPITHITYRKGSCAQRNAILDALAAEDGILLIIDDDFILHAGYLEALKRLGAAHPEVALFNGRLLKDGIIGPGLTVEEGERVLAQWPTSADASVPGIEQKISAYGCNMAIRLEHSRDVRFDENLPLYGWQEDVDFSCRLREHGAIVQTQAVSGVHLGVKLGRTSGVKFGYSQIANPIYLVRKGTMRLQHVLWIVARNVMKNAVRSVRPEAYIDRRGRLKGNCLAVWDLITGCSDPRRVLHMK